MVGKVLLFIQHQKNQQFDILFFHINSISKRFL